MMKSDNGGYEKVILVEHSPGPPKAANAWGSSSSGQSQMISGGIPFYLGISKIRAIIYRVEVICDKRT